MANKMLIDAAHPEETRVVVLRGNRVEEFDFESASKKPLRGNIYLAKVTRVEPSLQAAFIEYGGNRHGFLAFSEIHPDYYQIPVADRQALLEDEARAHREDDDEQRSGNPRRSRRRKGGGSQSSEKRATTGDESVSEPADGVEGDANAQATSDVDADERSTAADDGRADVEAVEGTFDEPALPFAEAGDSAPDVAHDALPQEARDEALSSVDGDDADTDEQADDVAVANRESVDGEMRESTFERETEAREDTGDFEAAPERESAEDGEHEEEVVEQLGGDALEDVPYRAPRPRRHYKIQEVIKRRQILLVQVVKEERGNKGAALTTYLSLAGRYSVLMPNTARGGGISRKITDSDDRKRLKAIAHQLDVPEGMGVILRTAGAARSDSEVKRDFEYLLRMWETVRELTLRSSAPMLVYEEGSLIKRAIRDLYSKEIDEVCVAGEPAYREAKDYMRLLMPTHAKNVQLYRDSQPIFAKSGVEAQLDAMFSNHVTLKSGGYIVINQTEALVAIDVNSGRSTREHNIEDTALRTNLEAADEVARQLRLRDLAGLIVVDFIDMEEGRNNRAVERRIKDALKNDRARIQIGRISHFGLLEMSRQRIRTGVLEGSTVICPHCAGAGTVRSTSSIALHVLRVLEDTLIRSAEFNLVARTRTEVALYILNQKRAHLMDLELRFGVSVAVLADATLTGTIYHALERGEPATPPIGYQARQALPDQTDIDADEDEIEIEEEAELEGAAESEATAQDGDEGERPSSDGEGGDRRRKRRRRRRGRDRDGRGPSSVEADGDQPSDEGMETLALAGGDLGADFGDGFQEDSTTGDGTRSPMDDGIASEETPEAEVVAPSDLTQIEPASSDEVAAEPVPTPVAEAPTAEEPPRRRRSRRATGRGAASTDETTAVAPVAPPSDEAPPAPRRSRRTRARPVEEPTLSFEAPSADRDVGADTVAHHPPETQPEPVEAVADAAFAAPPITVETPAVSPPEPASNEPAPADAEAAAPAQPDEPPRAKRSGWWQRAKATLTGD